MAYYVAIDIGGTAVKHGVADAEGRFLEKGVFGTGLPAAGIPRLLDLVTAQIRHYQACYDIAGVGVDTAGVVDAERGTILMEARNFPGYEGTPLRQYLEDACGIPCAVENDANAAGLGEYWLGAGQGASSLVCLTVGTGIGGCVLLDGKLLHGCCGSAGEVGYMRLHGSGADLESSAAVPWLLRTVTEQKGMPAGSLTGRDVFALAQAGDTVAAEAIGTLVHRLVVAIENICCVVNPELVLLGGGIMGQHDYLRPLLEAEKKRIFPPYLEPRTRLDFARLGNDAGMAGALRNLLDRMEGKRNDFCEGTLDKPALFR